MDGYSIFNKYSYFMKSTFLLFLITFFISLFCHYYFIYALIIHLILIFLWGVTYMVTIKKFEQKNIIYLLKEIH